MKGPVATVELWEKGRCVFSHAVSRELLQAAVDEGGTAEFGKNRTLS